MSRFITRIELFGSPTWQDYDKLHTAMESKGFNRTITGDNGVVYKLPPATYYGEATLTAEQVRQHASTAAPTVWNQFSVFTNEVTNSAWSGLEVA